MDKKQEVLDYLSQGYLLHLNEYIPTGQKTKKRIYFIKEKQVDKNDYKQAINIDQKAAKDLIKNKEIILMTYHLYSKTYILNK